MKVQLSIGLFFCCKEYLPVLETGSGLERMSGIVLREAQKRQSVSRGPDPRPYPDDQAGLAAVPLLLLSPGNNTAAVYNSTEDLYC